MLEIRDRMRDLLKKAGHPLPAAQILQEALNIFPPNQLAAEKVLQGILGADARFIRAEAGWFLKAAPFTSLDILLQKTVFLAVQQARRAAGPIAMRGAVYWTGRDRVLIFDSSMRIPIQDIDQLIATSDTMVFWQRMEFKIWDRYLAALGRDGWQGRAFCLGSLAAHVLQRPSARLLPEDLARLLDIGPPCVEEPESVARFYCRVFEGLLAHVPEEARNSIEQLHGWLNGKVPTVDYSRFSFDRSLIDQLPESPGVYIMRDRTGRILYVGKSRRLRRRVRSYFASKALSDPKTVRIHRQLYSIEVCETPNEVEALLLEMNLIGDFRPRINLQQKVHEQRTTHARERNLILLAPRPGHSEADLYYLVQGQFAGQGRAKLGLPAPQRVRTRIKSLYFTKRQPKLRHRESWETELISRWLGSNRQRLNWVDVDDAGGIVTTLRRLDCYLADPGRLAMKVLYR